MRRHNGLLALTCGVRVRRNDGSMRQHGARRAAGCGRSEEATHRKPPPRPRRRREAATRPQEAEAKAEGREATDDASARPVKPGAAIDAATETIDVKTALMADASVDASDINVDTFHETKTVVLKGSVPTAAQKTEAGKHRRA